MDIRDALMQTIAAMGGDDNIYWAPAENGDSKTLGVYERYAVLDLSGLTTGETADLYLPDATACRGASFHIRVMTAVGSSGTFHIHSNPGDTTDINQTGVTAQHEDIIAVSDGLSWQLSVTDTSR